MKTKRKKKNVTNTQIELYVEKTQLNLYVRVLGMKSVCACVSLDSERFFGSSLRIITSPTENTIFDLTQKYF